MQFETNENKIQGAIGKSITKSMKKAVELSDPKTPQEPVFVAELIDGVTQGIYNSLNKYANNYKCTVSGVFCHKKPCAKFGASSNPELGDLLMIYIEENEDSVLKCNALLLQAKKTDKDSYKISGEGEKNQLKLYEEWPDFELLKADAYTGMSIKVQPKTINTGAQYLLFRAPYNSKNVCCAYADKKLVPEKRLSNQLIDFLKFFSGRTFQPVAPVDEWSKLILYLIRISGVSTYNLKAGDRTDADRRKVYGDITLLEKIDEILEKKKGQEKSIVEDVNGEKTGFSCILIYSQEKKENDCQQHPTHAER